jgi:hypothetical protein
MTWKRTGDPLGDFVRLIQLLEELLDQIRGQRGGSLGEKLHDPRVQDFLQGLPERDFVRRLEQVLALRNRIIHERAEVPAWAFQEVPPILARLLYHLELQGYYTREEAEVRIAFLEAPPPPKPGEVPQVIHPEAAQAPPLRERPPKAFWMCAWPGLPVPRRALRPRPLVRSGRGPRG